jgi:hypothetical protein
LKGVPEREISKKDLNVVKGAKDNVTYKTPTNFKYNKMALEMQLRAVSTSTGLRRR